MCVWKQTNLSTSEKCCVWIAGTPFSVVNCCSSQQSPAALSNLSKIPCSVKGTSSAASPPSGQGLQETGEPIQQPPKDLLSRCKAPVTLSVSFPKRLCLVGHVPVNWISICRYIYIKTLFSMYKFSFPLCLTKNLTGGFTRTNHQKIRWFPVLLTLGQEDIQQETIKLSVCGIWILTRLFQTQLWINIFML